METITDTSLQISRTLPASRERVYATWCDRELANEWWGPDGSETLELTIDARVGGQYRWRLRSQWGEMTAFGEYREVEPGRKVVYTWQWEDDPEWKDHESLVTVEFIEVDEGRTEILLTHKDLPSIQSRENHTGGWNGALDKFERLLAK